MSFVKSAAHLLYGADIVFGNLEGSFITDEMEPQKCSRRHRAIEKLAMNSECLITSLFPLKELGFNVMNQDNNHSEDYGLKVTFLRRKN